MDIKAGDEVRVFDRWHNGKQDVSWPGEVVKVGRTLATIRYHGAEAAFRLDTGHLNDKNYGSQTYFLTPAQVEDRDRESAALAVLKDAGFEVHLGKKPPAALIEALAGVAKTFSPEA